MAHAECSHGTDLTLFACPECENMDREFANRVDGIIGYEEAKQKAYAENAKYQAGCLGTQGRVAEPISSEQYLNEQIRLFEARLEFARWLKEAILKTPPHEQIRSLVSDMIFRGLL